MNKPVTRKSIHFLSQPYTLMAYIIYAINELILQRYFPSWLSGKLSDFAWLFIAPVIFTLVLSFIFPSRHQKTSNILLFLAYGFTAAGFICIKTIPCFHQIFMQSWKSVFHYPAAVVPDTTDLLALLAIPVSYFRWQNKETVCINRAYKTALLIPLFGFLTLADASAPIRGIYDLSIQHDQIIAQTSYQGIYFSEDGGLSWSDCSTTSNCLTTSVKTEMNKIIHLPDTDIQYAINDAGIVEISHDAGLNWKSIYDAKYFSNAAQYYQLQTRPNAVSTNPGAQDALYDPATGNVIIAMGLQGAIVIEPDGNILQVGIGENQPTDLGNPGVIFSILFPFLLLSLAVIAILYASIIIVGRQKKYQVLAILTFLAWAYLTITFPELFSGYEIVLGIPLLLVVLGLLTWILIYANKESKNLQTTDRSQILAYLRITIPGGIAFFFCYVLWYLNIIPSLQWTTFISLTLMLGWFIYCGILSYRSNKKP